jgi:hypothetical protein
MMLKDRKCFSFIVNEVKKEIFLLIQKTKIFLKRRIENLNISTKDEFYKIRKKFSEMSDKIRFMNRAEIAVPTLVAVGENGDKSRLNAKPKNKNFIERFE